MKICKQCQSSFEVTDEDRRFYDRVSPEFDGRKYQIPEPDLCPDCRYQRRLVWRAELHVFKRKSDFSGETILSVFPPDNGYKVYAEKEWWSDAFGPLEYGREFDFSRPFFEQFDGLFHQVPLNARAVNDNQNCDYINSASWNKNCYLIAGANRNEDCYYGNFVNYCQNCVDNNFINRCELCYECVDWQDCYNLRYSTQCNNCSDSYFLFNCKSSRNCFGSVNLVEKEYVFMNEQLMREEYEKKIQNLELDKRSRIREARKFFETHKLKFPHKYMFGEVNQNVLGNCIDECKNTHYCFDVSQLEDCKYCSWFHESKNCMDIYAWGAGTEESYFCTEIGERSYHILFSVLTYNGTNVYYSYGCQNSQDVFGCVSLKGNRNCILNKQYSKEEYNHLVPKIIEHMKSTGEWGQFFPMRISPMNYNQTIAQDYVPITKEEAERLGAKWGEEPEVQPPAEKVSVPDSIHDVDGSICDKVLTCAETGKPYRIIPQEFRFYKQNNVPVPDVCFEVRHKRRFQLRNPRKLWDRKCAKCGIDIRTTYSPDRPEIVYCEQCFLKEVY